MRVGVAGPHRERASPSAAAFVERELTALTRLAHGLCGRRANAEDLVSAAVMGAFERWESIDNPGAYVRRSILHLYLNDLRRLRTGQTALVPGAPASDPTSEVAGRVDLEAALADLTPIQRAVVVLRFMEDRTAEDTARILGRPAGSVRRITHNALGILRASPALNSNGGGYTLTEKT